MSGKRQAETVLTHDNWDEEEDSDEAGEFKKASVDELQKRKIKTAKRRLDSNADEKRIFSGFAGFGSLAPEKSASLFAFNSGSAPTNGNGSEHSSSTGKKPSTESIKSGTSEDSKSAKYSADLKALNEQVLSWIKSHVEKNPVCILTPIFKDYDKYLKEIEEKDSSKNDVQLSSNKISFTAPTSVPSATKTTESPTDTPKATTTTSSIFGNIPTNIFSSAVAYSPPKVGGDPAPATTAGTFSFGSSLSSSPSTTSLAGGTSGFSFGSGSKPFTFGNVTPNPPSENKGEEADEDAPPVVEFTPVVEENSKFSKRVKVFFKQDDAYSDRGVGTLHIKEVDGKSQLLVRADTNLGNILLNILITESLPMRRLGSNNVMLCCIPTPDAKPPPKTVLLRVKTGQEADDLLATIKTYQK